MPLELPKSQLLESVEYRVVDYLPQIDPNAASFVPLVFRRLQEQDLLKVYFHDYPGFGYHDFEAALGDRAKVTTMVFRVSADGATVEHLGMGVLVDVVDNGIIKRAIGGFVFFREYWNRHDSDAAAHAILKHWFEDLRLDVLVGVTPSVNRSALAFITRLGFVISGEVPYFSSFDGKPTPSRISFMTSGKYQAMAEGWTSAGSNGNG